MSTASSSPVGFSWLSPTYRPSEQEVETYAEMIASREGRSSERAEDFRREAELQLWIWRNETHQRPPRRNKSRAPAIAVLAG